MTDTIPLSQLARASDNARRDQWGRYLIRPLDGGKPIGYTRVTTVAGTLDSGGGLAPWKAAMAASGIIMRRGLRAQWEALLAEYGDPWYDSAEGKARCKRLVEECAAVGGANDRKEMGTALHTITALVDAGRNPTHLTEETEADLKAYVAGLAEAGIAIVPGMIEVTVVLDDFQVAGTFDRLVTVPSFDLPLIADLKTGADLSYSWQSIAVQLAAYSRANAIYHQGSAADGTADVRHPMPAVDQRWGLIFWLNAGTGTLELHTVNLELGWEAFKESMWVRGWRTNRSVARPLADVAPGTDSLVPALQASLDALAVAAPVEQASDGQPELRDWLQGRINVIGAHPEARADLGTAWPADMPTLKASDQHSSDQLAAIEQLLEGIERRWTIAFPPPRPGETEAIAAIVTMFPGSSTTTTNPTDKEPA